tara:strand:+ start:827 stop:1048 length:222 start_codon:yes stop_codon:yes gene_type:complete
MGHLLVAKTRTGDQLHIAYCDEKYGVMRRTSCGCRVDTVRQNGPLRERPGLLCEKCFPADLPRENIKNATFAA